MEALLASEFPSLQRPGGLPAPLQPPGGGSGVPPLSLALSGGSGGFGAPAPAFPALHSPGAYGSNMQQQQQQQQQQQPYSYSAGPALRTLPAVGGWPGGTAATLNSWPHADGLDLPQQHAQPASAHATLPHSLLVPPGPEQAAAAEAGLVPLHLSAFSEMAAAAAAASAGSSQQAAPTSGSAALPPATQQGPQQPGWPSFLP